MVRLPWQTLPGQPFTLRVRAQIDALDRLTLTSEGATWKHLKLGWPKNVMLGERAWPVRSQPTLPNSGDTAFMPDDVDFAGATVQIEHRPPGNPRMNRGTVTLVSQEGSLEILIRDGGRGNSPFDFTITFTPRSGPPNPPSSKPGDAGTVLLHIRATVEGNNELNVTQNGAVWQYHRTGSPRSIFVNEVPWEPIKTAALKNAAPTQFLFRPVNFPTARILRNRGYDGVKLTPRQDGLTLGFTSNALTGATYDVVIAIDVG